MVAYEFYQPDSVKEYDLLGILPERRKDARRITDASVMKWGKMLLGHNGSKKSIFYKKVAISEYTGKFFRVTPSNILIKGTSNNYQFVTPAKAGVQ
jgi:arginyl-tRNA--protein-N-Asp/Glu arginylyltransferase